MVTNSQTKTSSSSIMEPGYLGLVPVFFAFPCRTCAAPGEPCQCGGICCAHCGQICAAQLQGESSPRVIEFSPGATGGSEDNELKDNSVYKLLAALFTTTNQWSCVEYGLYIRSQLLPELGVCYITDEECNTRPLGALSDWIKIAQVPDTVLIWKLRVRLTLSGLGYFRLILDSPPLGFSLWRLPITM